MVLNALRRRERGNNTVSDTNNVGVGSVMNNSDNNQFYQDEQIPSSPATSVRYLEIEEEPPAKNKTTQTADLLGMNNQPSNTLRFTHRTSGNTNTNTNNMNVYNVPSISSGNMRNVMDVEPSSLYRDRLFEPNNSNKNIRESIFFHSDGAWKRSVLRLWVLLFLSFVVLGMIVATAAIHARQDLNHQNHSMQEYVMSETLHKENHVYKAEESVAAAVLEVVTEALGDTQDSTENNSKIRVDKSATTKETKSPAKQKPLLQYTSFQQATKNNETLLKELEDKFDVWVSHHKRDYKSAHEHRRRFEIWAENHLRTEAKNLMHGPCKMTNQPVFGSNHLKDLTHEEFTQKFLTGYKSQQLQTSIDISSFKATISSVHPLESVRRHESVQGKYQSHWNNHRKQSKMIDLSDHILTSNSSSSSKSSSSSSSGAACGGWLNWTCAMRWIYTMITGRSLEPKYDVGKYPSSIDWRNMGVVTSVHSQGACGACWAITAVETVESAYAISSGNLIDLAETEVIVCDDSCEYCYGGWPQNAYDYIKENKGLPAENTQKYDDEWLLAMTMVLQGESDMISNEDIESFMSATCPAGNNNGSSHSGDNNNNNSYQSQTRYGAIKGYMYATDKCTCYSDGSGCSCNNQNEHKAVANIANYGPATICIDASYLQDYAGGILTADIGCSQDFLDMNHCVQVVGYAYTSGNTSQETELDEANNDSKSKSGSQDENKENRTGYWIVRNQWSSSWGMNGYAYLAMGENTCGILNDITIALMDN